MQQQRHLFELGREDALGLLARAPFGRVVFTHRALPTVRPVNHIVADGEVVIRTRLTTTFGQAVTSAGGLIVAYQADEIEPHSRLGWSVVVTGTAYVITDPDRVASLTPQVKSWLDHEMDGLIAIKPQVVNGFRLTVAHD